LAFIDTQSLFTIHNCNYALNIFASANYQHPFIADDPPAAPSPPPPSFPLLAAIMVFFFTPRSSLGKDVIIYMGKDKYENEDLIKYGLNEDIW
jgi:hypothetical protein